MNLRKKKRMYVAVRLPGRPCMAVQVPGRRQQHSSCRANLISQAGLHAQSVTC